jgi:hypothetical protein
MRYESSLVRVLIPIQSRYCYLVHLKYHKKPGQVVGKSTTYKNSYLYSRIYECHSLYIPRKITVYIARQVRAAESMASKGGHPQFKSAPPQLRNIADYQIDCGVAD